MTDEESNGASPPADEVECADADANGNPQTEGCVRDGAVECTWRTNTVERTDGPVALVALRLRNDAVVTQQVRVRNRLDGPPAPPRRRGVSESGWTDRGFTGDVPADGTLALGYACVAPTDGRPPISLTVLGPAEAFDDEQATASSVVRTLGDARPPAAVVESTSNSANAGGESNRAEAVRAVTTTDCRADRSASEPDPLPSAVAAWLHGVETRLDAAAGLDGASVVTATATLSTHGGLDGLLTNLDADLAALQAVAQRVEGARDRAETVEPPLETLRRLA